MLPRLRLFALNNPSREGPRDAEGD
jgi:hypothetical protein